MIAIDWGTSSLRAWRLDPGGAILDQRRAALGILACEGRFEAVLAEQVGGWDDPLLLLSGMIGSRQGWHEAPYVPCPAAPAALAAALMPVEAASLPGRRIRIVPGLQTRDADGVADVMRGEETQLCGLIDELGPGTHTVCLPGTHSKWASIVDGRIDAFRTAMTGEVYHVLRTQTILGRLMTEPAPDFEPAAFERGLRRAERPGGLLHHAFGVRTEGLTNALSARELPDYLSGILIGHELKELAPAAGGVVHLIGAPALNQRYGHALQARGCTAVLHGEDLAARGLWRLSLA